jgi:hypothetical protein
LLPADCNDDEALNCQRAYPLAKELVEVGWFPVQEADSGRLMMGKKQHANAGATSAVQQHFI